MPQIERNGGGEYALVTLAAGAKLASLVARAARPSWRRYCQKHGYDLVVFEDLLDRSARAAARSPAWQKCLVADNDVLKGYSAACWIDADIIINDRAAEPVFAGVDRAAVGAVEGWASPTVESYAQFLGRLRREASDSDREKIDLGAESYYARFGLATDYPTVAQTGVLVFNPRDHGPIFRDVYDRYEDRGSPDWHYEMRPLSFELHRQAKIHWLDPRFNHNAICDIVSLQGREWPLRYSLLDKVTLRAPYLPLLDRLYRPQLTALGEALKRAWFLHFAGFRFGLLLQSI